MHVWLFTIKHGWFSTMNELFIANGWWLTTGDFSSAQWFGGSAGSIRRTVVAEVRYALRTVRFVSTEPFLATTHEQPWLSMIHQPQASLMIIKFWPSTMTNQQPFTSRWLSISHEPGSLSPQPGGQEFHEGLWHFVQLPDGEHQICCSWANAELLKWRPATMDVPQRLFKAI